MSNIAIKGADTGTGVFTLESPATNTDRTLVLPDEAGTVLTSASSITQNAGPAFYVTSSTNRSLSSSTYTVAQFDTETFDTDSCWDTSTYKFTPNVAGYYNFGLTFAVTSSQTLLMQIRKNSTGLTIHYDFGSTRFTAHGGILLYMNGTTDFVQFIVRTENASTLDSVTSRGYGYLVRAA